MEDSGRANFIVEVDDLTHRIVTLRDTITGLFDVLKRRKHDNVDADNVINQSTTTLNEISSAVVQLPTELTSLPTIDLADQLTGIRGHLLRLCQTEAKVAGVRSADRQLSSSREVVPYTRDATAGVMQLWQRVFEDTLNKYNSISTALANQEATGTLVQVWENHLDQVASSLSSPVPGSYQEVLEELRLASLHQSLIMQNQDTLMSLSVPLSSYKPLITRHNNILQQLQLRSEQLMAKQAMWEAYKLNVEKLAVWLREMEKDKLRLSLKHLPLRRLDKMIMRLEELLGKIPTGEIMHRSLLKEQAVLQDNYNNSTLSAVRMELHGLQERLSSLKAGLRTWLDHLNRLKVLSADFESKTEEISGVIISAQDHVDQPYPELAVNVENDLKTSQDHLNNLEKALTTLNSVSDILEQVHPAVSPADIKQTGSRVWLLQQQRADLHHRIQLRMEELRHAGDISSLLSAQVSNIEAWTNVFDNKIIRKDLPIASVIHRLESDCTQELLQKQEEQQLFDRLHSQLIIPESYNQSESTKSESDQSQAGKTESDQSKKTNLKDLFEECHKLLDHANDGLKERIAYLKDIAAKEKDLLRRIEIEKDWMHKIEAQLAVPIQFKDLYGNGIEDLRKNQKDLEKEINQRSANISSIVQDFEALCGDDGLSVSLLVNSDRAVTQMQTRWSQVCTKSGRRTDHLRLYTNLRTEFLEHNFNIKSYITSANQDLDRLDKLCLDDQQKLLTELESDLEPNLDRVTKLSDTYTLMAKQGMLDNKDETRSSYITIFKDIKTLEDALKEVRRKNVDSLDKYERLSKEVCQSCDILEDFFNGELKRKLEKYEKMKLERNAEIQSIGEVKDTPEPSVTTVEETKQTADSAKPFDLSDEIIQSEVAKPNVSDMNIQSEAEMKTKNQSEATTPSTESQSETSIAVTPAVPEKSTKNSEKYSKDNTVEGDETIEVVDSQIQVDTLRFEEDASVQANTLNLNLLSPNPDSGVFVSASSIGGEVNQVPIDPLLATPEGIPDLPELDDDNRLMAATANAAQSTSTAAKDQASKDVDGPKEDSATKPTDQPPTTSLTYSDVVKKDVSIPPSETENLPKVEIRESVDISNFVVTASDKAAVGGQSSSNLAAAEQLTVHDSSSLREGSASPISTSCPLCRRQDWKQLEGDLWRLELWLDQATRILNQYLSQGIPSSIEQLEESIQDHREFLLNLDSHKSMALSINVIGSHLAEHSSDSEKADRLVARLAKVNNDWDSVCEKATDWQTRLQKALLENSEFHATIDELLGWLEKTRTIVEEAEPIDLSQNKEVLLDKYNKFLDLKKDLHRCEPRVVSLQEAADQLEIQADAATCREVKIKLNRLSQSLKGLIQVCGIYCCNLARALDLPVLPGESLEASSLYETARVLPALTQQLLEGRSTRAPRSSDDSSEDELNRGVLSRSYRFLGRVVRAALPIQALMLLLLGVSSIVPLERDELICTLQNNLQRSLEPMLRWSNGPPPI